MKSYIDEIIEKLDAGYIIFCEEYVTGEKIYSIRTPKVNGSCSIYAEIAQNIAVQIAKRTGKEIIKGVTLYMAHGFIPMPVKPNCIRFN